MYPDAIFIAPEDVAHKISHVVWHVAVSPATLPATLLTGTGLDVLLLPSLMHGMSELVLYQRSSGTFITADVFYADNTSRRLEFARPPTIPITPEEHDMGAYSESNRQLFDALFCDPVAVLQPEIPNPRLTLYRYVHHAACMTI